MILPTSSAGARRHTGFVLPALPFQGGVYPQRPCAASCGFIFPDSCQTDCLDTQTPCCTCVGSGIFKDPVCTCTSNARECFQLRSGTLFLQPGAVAPG